jgi:hypothetical protein
MCRARACNVLRCHPGRTRTFFMAGTNYTDPRGKDLRQPIGRMSGASRTAVAWGHRPLRNTLKTIVNRVISAATRLRDGIFQRFGTNGIWVAYPTDTGMWVASGPCNSSVSFALTLRCNERERLPKTPRLAGCGATSPLFFCLASASLPRHQVSLARQRCQAPHHRHEGVEINRLRHVQVEAGPDRRRDIPF